MKQLSRDWHFEECEKEGCNNGAVVGFSNGEIHVCSVCAGLPEFSRMKPTVLPRRLTQMPPPQPVAVANGEYGDAYQGAREDLSIWKRRALESEALARRLEQIKVPDDDKTNMLCDSAYVNGLQAGFSMGQMNQEAEYAQTIELYRKGIREYRAAMLNAEPVSQPYTLPENVRDALTKALQAMEFMGDTLNNLDAVCAEDVEFVTPAFDAVREVLATPQEPTK